MITLSSEAIMPDGDVLARDVNLAELNNIAIDFSFISTWQDYHDNFGVAFLTLQDGTILISRNVYTKDKNIINDISLSLKQVLSTYRCKRYWLVTDDVIETKVMDANRNFEESVTNESSEGNPALDEFTSLLWAAHELGANDIHITALKSKGKASALFSVEKSLRINNQYHFVSYERCFSMLSAMFDTLGKKPGQDDFDGMSAQETSFTYSLPVAGDDDDITLTCRVAKTMPSLPDDIHVVIRLIEQSEPLPIKALGLPEDKKNLLIKCINLKQGAVITCGPMGSGKTVTMTSALNCVSDHLQVHTIEDPIEVRFNKPNYVQNQLGGDISRQLSLVLRQNVSVLYLGELRDEVTSAMFMKHVKTGHLGAATTHANSAIGVVQRLQDLGIPIKELGAPGVLSLLMAQRLEQKLCPHCKIKITPELYTNKDNYELQQAIKSQSLSLTDDIYISDDNGCKHCHAGRKGRQIIIEQVEIGRLDRTFILQGDFQGWRDYLDSMGFDSLKNQTIAFVKQGVLCPINSLHSLQSD